MIPTLCVFASKMHWNVVGFYFGIFQQWQCTSTPFPPVLCCWGEGGKKQRKSVELKWLSVSGWKEGVTWVSHMFPTQHLLRCTKRTSASKELGRRHPKWANRLAVGWRNEGRREVTRSSTSAAQKELFDRILPWKAVMKNHQGAVRSKSYISQTQEEHFCFPSFFFNHCGGNLLSKEKITLTLFVWSRPFCTVTKSVVFNGSGRNQ